MEYSKSEIRELTQLIEEDIQKLEHYIQLYIPDPVTGMLELCIADNTVTELDAHLKCMKKHIIDKDKYDLAVKISDRLTPVWRDYLKKVSDKEERKRLKTMPGHLHFTNIRDTMIDWESWIQEYEESHQNDRDNKPSADAFLAAVGGLSRDCLRYIEHKYDLGYKENVIVKMTLSPNVRHQIFNALPALIKTRYNEGVVNLVNLKEVMNEIEVNVDSCKSRVELERYVVKLLEPFRATSDRLTIIFQHKNFESQSQAIEEEMSKLGTPENCLNDLLFIMTKFANNLYAILIQRGFDLASFQDEVEIYLKKKWTWFDIAPYVGGKKRAQRFINQQTKPSESPSTETIVDVKEPVEVIIDKEKLKTLFVEVFFKLEFQPRSRIISTEKRTLFEEFYNRLELIMSSDDKNEKKLRNKQNLGSLAYMIHCSRFSTTKYHKPKLEGQKGCFAGLLGVFFEIVGKPVPKYTHPNHYDNPNDDLVAYFGDILKWENKKIPH